MLKKLFFALILGIFLISITSAAQTELPDPIKLYDCFDLPQTCSTCTYNNITSIIYPNGTIHAFSPEQNMTQSGAEFRFHTCGFTSMEGEYIVNGHGDLGGVDTIWNYKYFVNPSGEKQNSIFENPLFLILLLLSLVFLGLGAAFKIPSLGFIGSLILTIGGIYTMIYGVNNITNLYTRAIGLVSIGVGLLFMFISAYEWTSWGSQEDE